MTPILAGGNDLKLKNVLMYLFISETKIFPSEDYCVLLSAV